MSIDAGSYSDSAALLALAGKGKGALCTIVRIDGSYSRRLGAQLAIFEDGSIAGSLADGCLEAQLVRESQEARADNEPRLVRFGQGAAFLDFQLPCGSAIDVLVDPAPDMEAAERAVQQLAARHPASLSIPMPQRGAAFECRYLPEPRLIVLGSGPECEMLCSMARAFGMEPEWQRPRDQSGGELGLGQVPELGLDQWTAVALLFHDHEWERELLPWALRSDAFYVGVQGGAETRRRRLEFLAEQGLHGEDLTRLYAPVGMIQSARTPPVLALSILAEIVAAAEARNNR